MIPEFLRGVRLTRRPLCLLVFILACSTIVGCGSGGPEIASVEGRVTLDGKPLPNASVLFVPENGRPAGAITDADGRYVLNFTEDRQGAIPGKNRVRISTESEASQDENGRPIGGSPETVPAEYNRDSKLEFQVEPGKNNVANFDLKSGAGDAGNSPESPTNNKP